MRVVSGAEGVNKAPYLALFTRVRSQYIADFRPPLASNTLPERPSTALGVRTSYVHTEKKLKLTRQKKIALKI